MWLLLAFQAEVVYVDGTWRFEVTSFPSPHLVMARANCFSLDMISLTMSGLTVLEGATHSWSTAISNSASERSWVGENGGGPSKWAAETLQEESRVVKKLGSRTLV